MIFYNKSLDHKFIDYGIQIPISKSRSEKCFDYIKEKFPEKVKETDCSGLLPLSKEDLLLAHNSEFVSSLFNEGVEEALITCFELRNEDGSWNRFDPDSATKSLSLLKNEILLQGKASFLSMEQSLKSQFSYFLGGGMHHAMSFGGRGFCLVNDIVIGIRKLQKLKKIKTAWVVDVDAHKGCGTAELTQNDDTIQTLSLHMGKGWPLDSEKFDKDNQVNPWFIESTIDCPIFEGEEDRYHQVLKESLNQLEKKFEKPDLVVVVNGSDPYELDELPSASLLKLTLEQLLKRDTFIYHWLKERKIPQTYLMSGGYGRHSWEVYAQFLEYILKES